MLDPVVLARETLANHILHIANFHIGKVLRIDW